MSIELTKFESINGYMYADCILYVQAARRKTGYMFAYHVYFMYSSCKKAWETNDWAVVLYVKLRIFKIKKICVHLYWTD